MKTTETYEGKTVIIEWYFVEVNCSFGSNWVEWGMEGEGNDGYIYWGNCQADVWHPESLHADVTDIERCIL